MKKWLFTLMLMVGVVGLVTLTSGASNKGATTWFEHAEAYTETENAPEGYSVNQTTKTVTVTSAEGLAWWAYQVHNGKDIFSGSGQSYTLMINADELDMSQYIWTPVNGQMARLAGVTIQGKETGTVISGLTVRGAVGNGFYCGFIGSFINGDHGSGVLTIKNITFDGADVMMTDGQHYFGNIVGTVIGQAYAPVSMENVHVENSDVYGFGKVGGLIGQAYSSALTLDNCSVTDTEIHGAYNCGGLIGLRMDECKELTITDCTAGATWVQCPTQAYACYDGTVEYLNDNAGTKLEEPLPVSGIFAQFSYLTYLGYYAAWGDEYTDYQQYYNIDETLVDNDETLLFVGLCHDAQPHTGFDDWTVTKEAEGDDPGELTGHCNIDICDLTETIRFWSVSFDKADGSEPVKQAAVITDEDTNSGYITKPTDPVRAGYEFDGWYLGEERYDFSEPVTGNITLTAHWTACTITITPADIVAYTGGAGYAAVTDGDGNIIDEAENSGLPEPGYHLEFPDEVDSWLSERGVTDGSDLSGILKFTYDVTDESGASETREWTIYYAGVYSMEPLRNVYTMEPTGGTDYPVRLQFKDGDMVISSDSIMIEQNISYAEYSMTIDPGELDQNEIKAVFTVGSDTLVCNIEIGEGTLAVRGTILNETTNPIVRNENSVTGDAITAVAGSGIEFYINDSGVEVQADRVELLIDRVSNNASYNQAMAQDAISHVVDHEETDWSEQHDLSYEMAYLDLVDARNGNTWATLGENDSVTIYWPMPDSAKFTGDFYIVHYPAINREDILDAENLGQTDKNLIEGEVEYLNGNWYVVFETESFSPFVLLYEADNYWYPPVDDSETSPDPEPAPDPGEDNGGPEGLNTEDHYAYLIGFTDGTIRPEASITRAEVAEIFFRLLTDKARQTYWSQDSGYTDVDEDDWFNDAVSTLTNMGILEGDGDAFHPLNNITKAEFATIAVRFFDYTAEYRPGTFLDVEAGAWYGDYVQAASEMGLIEGDGNGYFEPMRSITRAEAVTIVNRTLGRAPHKGHLLPLEEMVIWPDNADPNAWYYAAMQEATNSHEYTWTTEDGETVEQWV